MYLYMDLNIGFATKSVCVYTYATHMCIYIVYMYMYILVQ